MHENELEQEVAAVIYFIYRKEMYMLRIYVNEKSYKAFIEYAIKTCKTFSLVFNRDDEEAYYFNDFYFMLGDYILSEKSILYHPDTGTFFDNAIIVYFKCCNDIKGILQTANSVYDWNTTSRPGELCFYRNGQKWFTCVCHAEYMFIYNETEEDLLFFEQFNIEYSYEV